MTDEIQVTVLPATEDTSAVYIPHITGGFSDWNDYLQADNTGTAAATFTLVLFNDKTMEKHVLIYNKKGNIITPEDKVVIMNVDFLRTGSMKVDVIKKEIKE